VEMDHIFGLKWLLGELSRLGFSNTVDDVTRYKQSVVCNDDPNDFIKHALQGCFSQWSVDNVDHNVQTIVGKGILHGMGLVLSMTGPNAAAAISNLPWIARHKLMKQGNIVQNKGIAVIPYCVPECSSLSKLSFKSLQ